MSTVIDRLKLTTVRTGFVLGGRIAPQRTVNRAARLFATPFASSRSRAQAAQGDTEMQRGELHVNGETIATYVWGDPSSQPYALLAHGWSSFGLRFLPWVAQLRAQGLAVVTFDQPGHGHSTGKLCTLPEFIATIRAIGAHYGNAALAVGHSLGGAAVTFAQDEAWRAEQLILVAPAADMKAAARRFFRFVHLAGYLREPFYAWLHRRTGVHIDELRVERKLPMLGQPALIVHDLDDADVPWGEGERYAQHWPGARLHTTQGLGHRRVLDAPEVIGAALAFMRGEQVGTRVVGSPDLALRM
ncbi:MULTISPECIES: alpha/beta fold hydrolase [Rhodanobacter]|uniref:alpha/beta fold hydrolase n=1 Tax=Rhodanobacter TaxID=75309 RepID=UPI00040EBD22|nr:MULTISPECIES: alpha/beta hydrolase [Rhodanobacter]KZC19518.1 hydrolase [Rhodanobacter denitrificans]UJJ49841.1 alpha/beta hydrolase [Rhodanobacter denitrificans]UJM92554.1 alpha/beta hydrolase [Rhodanobacter denitrificans]UJM96084.1 alpha/beta hydrolase [Rhodanobacter denitrificans]UJN21085.1 alpha/beta hydrolase [Rhodanobacter denitrificans]